MMDIKWDECGHCYSWQPAEYIKNGLCGGCTMAAGEEDTQPIRGGSSDSQDGSLMKKPNSSGKTGPRTS